MPIVEICGASAGPRSTQEILRLVCLEINAVSVVDCRPDAVALMHSIVDCLWTAQRGTPEWIS